MKINAKEIIKNKADKMVDLIIDEIGPEGEKKLTTSFIDKKTDLKYIISLKIESGDPQTLKEPIDDEEIPETIRDLQTRLVALEIKEDSDTVYDDSEIQARLTSLENKEDYDDSGLKARIKLIEDADLDTRVTLIEERLNE